jgi:hypothetical protein
MDVNDRRTRIQDADMKLLPLSLVSTTTGSFFQDIQKAEGAP